MESMIEGMGTAQNQAQQQLLGLFQLEQGPICN